jgi:ABC-type Fe3+ transport system substrate-binding protein
MDFTDPKWKGRIGWAPTHGEWQMILLIAIRIEEGEEAARSWSALFRPLPTARWMWASSTTIMKPIDNKPFAVPRNGSF